MAGWLKQISSTLAADLSQPLRVRLYRLICATTAAICLLIIFPTNLFQNLPPWVHIANVLLGLFALGCYGASRRGHHLFVTFFVALLVILNSTWNLDAGSQGSITYYFFPALLYPLAILQGRTRWAFTALTVVNLCALIAMDYAFPGLSRPLPQPIDRVLDLVTGAFSALLALGAILWLVLRAHDQEHNRLSEVGRELAASEQNYREIFNSTSDAMLIRDEQGRLLDVNERMCAMFGYGREAALRLSVDDISLGASPYSGVEAAEHMRRALAGVPQLYRWRNRRIDGTLFWSEIAMRAGEIAGHRRILVTIRDISDRLQTEVALRANEERLRLALEASKQGWFELNLQTGEGFSSDEYVRIIGYEPGEFVTTQANWLENVHPEDREAAARELRACVASGQSHTLEYRRQTRSGDWKWIRSIAKVVERDASGRPLRMVGTHTDITERKELEAMLLHSQRLEAIGTLAAGVAHDLNNILTPMLMASSVLGEKMSDDEDRALMGMLETGARRGAAIVQQLLAFSRDMAQRRVEVDPAQVITDMLEMMRAVFPSDIRVDARIEKGLWTLTADPIQLHQVLMNLCVNARDAMPRGGRLTLRAANDAGGARTVVITVTDTGQGIAPEIRSRIFDPFFTTKEVGKGTGLGLSTVYGIVKSHGGTVSVESEPGRGSTFRVVLPARIVESPVALSAVETP